MGCDHDLYIAGVWADHVHVRCCKCDLSSDVPKDVFVRILGADV